MIQICNTEKTLKYFFINPTKKASLLEISRTTNLAHTSTKKNLDKLLKLNLIKKSIEIRGTRKFPLYSANINNIFKNNKIIYNLHTLLNSGLMEFLEDNLTPKSIVLFGSYLRGEDLENSDVDLFIECKKQELNLKKFEKILNRKIELHFNPSFLTYPMELKNNMINGYVLKGFLEGYK